MKKQYLISLLGLTALFISFGNGFLTFTSSSPNASTLKSNNTSNLSEEELDTIEEYSSSDEYFNYSIEQVSAGDTHSAAIINDGTGTDGDHLYTWGDNTYGQLGLGDTKSRNIPTEVEELSEKDIEQISLGAYHSAATINNNGTDELYTWGYNASGQLGLGAVSEKNVPTKVTKELPTGEIEQISLCFDSSAAIVNNDLYTWGENSDGQLGLDDTIGRNIPTKVTNGLPEGEVEQISMGQYHSAAVANGDLYTWGDNTSGQLGLGDDAEYNTPQEVKELSGKDIKQISMGTNHSAAVVNGGTTDELYTWGENRNGQLGHGDNISSNIPQEVTKGKPFENIEQISMGGNHSSAIVDGDLYTWGQNDKGQLGLGDNTNYNTPQEVTDLSDGNIEQISMGKSHSAAVANGELYTWGDNYYGQLGLGDESGEPYNTPQLVPGLPYLNEISSNVKHKEKESKEIIIEYRFETNIDVESVDINLTSNGSTTTEKSKPVENGEDSNIWEGNQDFKIDSEYGATNSYSIDLNYKDGKGNTQKIENIVEDTEFTLEGVITEPELTHDKVIISETNPEEKASIHYEVTENATDESGNSITLEKVEWINEISGKDDVTLDSSSEHSDDLKYANFTPGTTYEDTILKATFNDGEEEWPIQSDVGTFTMDPADSPTTVKQDGEVNVKSETRASVDYKVDLGDDVHGNKVEIVQVRWMDGDTKLDSSDSKKTSGTLRTRNLTSGETYNNTTIEVDLISEDNVATFANVNVKDFTMKTNPTVENTGLEVNQKDASVSYEVNQGNDQTDTPYIIESIQWVEEGTTNAFLGSEAVEDPNEHPEDKLTVEGLTPTETYDASEILVTFIDAEAKDVRTTVDGFTTKPVEPTNPTVSTTNEIKYTNQNEASIDYKIDQGNDKTDTPYTIESIQWVEEGTNNAFLGSEAVKDPNEHPEDKLTVEGLTPGINYGSSEILVTFEGTDEKRESVNDLDTPEVDIVKPTITSTIDESKTTVTTATFDYEATLGQDSHGNDYVLTEIKIVDPKDETNSLGQISDEDGLALNGQITINDLDPNTTYDNLRIEAIFIDSENEAYEDDIVETITPFTTLNNGLGGGAILGIIAAALLLIVFVSWGLTYLSNKYKIDEHKDEKIEAK